ncbi:MAG TPA: phosphotransferase [Aldersonia sp.]
MTRSDPRPAVQQFLRAQGLLAPGAEAVLTPLHGGVSSDLWKAELGDRTVCVKGALAQLKVDREWWAPISRNRVEYDWLRSAGAIAPTQVPRVLGHDEQAGLFAMEFLPPQDYPVWKRELLAGRVDAGAARQVGDLVGRLHSASAADPDSPTRFATDDNFTVLRIDPFLRVTAEAHPDLATRFDALAATTAGTHLAVVHGDVSPKNILLGPHGPVLLDAECAWFGDPAFDIAFCLSHLVIKAIKVTGTATEILEAASELVDGHARHVDWEPVDALDARVAALLPALALARVDGTSPVDYLDATGQDRVRAAALPLLRDPAPTTADALDRWAGANTAPAPDTKDRSR